MRPRIRSKGGPWGLAGLARARDPAGCVADLLEAVPQRLVGGLRGGRRGRECEERGGGVGSAGEMIR